MSNELEKKSSSTPMGIPSPIPKEILEKTIDDLLNDEQSEINIKGGNLVLRNKGKDNTITLSYTKTKSDLGYEMHASVHPAEEQKKDYVNVIKELKKSGKSQKDIAYELDISTSYVSKLLKEEKNKKGK